VTTPTKNYGNSVLWKFYDVKMKFISLAGNKRRLICILVTPILASIYNSNGVKDHEKISKKDLQNILMEIPELNNN